jgi:hypothetical protein
MQFVKARNNLARHDIQAHAYTFDTKPVGLERTSGQEIQAPISSGRTSTPTSTQSPQWPERELQPPAKRFLTEALAIGRRPATAIIDEAEANGISEWTLLRAKADLGVMAKKNGLDGGWMWNLPN